MQVGQVKTDVKPNSKQDGCWLDFERMTMHHLPQIILQNNYKVGQGTIVVSYDSKKDECLGEDKVAMHCRLFQVLANWNL
jgi:hypothetical protein